MNLEEVSKIEKNGKTFYKLKIDGKNFTAFDSCKGFEQLESGEVKAGDNAKVEFSEKKSEFKGQPVTYRNIISFDNIEKGEPKKIVDNSMSKADWADKDRRITRMSCLARAIEFFELNKERMKEEFPGVISEETVINIAKKFEEQYVYGGKE
jgi:hypothetical protein